MLLAACRRRHEARLLPLPPCSALVFLGAIHFFPSYNLRVVVNVATPSTRCPPSFAESNASFARTTSKEVVTGGAYGMCGANLRRFTQGPFWAKRVCLSVRSLFRPKLDQYTSLM